jgi:tetratricopeptide (TPR) repeat protein
VAGTALPVAIKYRAFLSYAHADMAWARWLHAALEAFRIDKALVGHTTPIGPVPQTLRPIFRDREDFSGGHTLTDATVAALDASSTLIVLCSASAATRPAVNEEVRLFRSRHPDRPVIPVIVEGTFPGNFPPALRHGIAADSSITEEPITILGPDLRESGDGKTLGLAKVVAGLIGIGADDIFRRAERARRRRNRVWGALAGLFLTLAVAASGSAAYAWQQLKTNEAFLDATLERFTGMVERAVSLSQSYAAPLPATLGFLKEAEGLLDVMAHYGRPTPQLAFRKAVMLRAFADNYRDLGQSAESESRIAQARQLMSELVRQNPDHAEWAFELGLAYERNGNLLVTKGRLADALVEYRARQQITERLVKADPDSTRWQRDLSVSYSKVGDVLVAQGHLGEALISFRDSNAAFERLAKTDPGNAQWQRDLSVSYEKLGNVLAAQGRLADALTAYRGNLGIAQRLAEADHRNAQRQRDLVVSSIKVGDVLMAQGNHDEALKSFRAIVAVAERLTQTDPSNTGWQRDLSVAYERVGDVLAVQGQRAEALASLRASLAIRERLTQTDPSNAQWQRDLSVSYDRIGNVQTAQGHRAEALKSFQESLAIRERLAKTDPGNAEWQRDLSVANEKIGDALAAQGNRAAALTSFRDSLAIREQLAEADPSNAQWQWDVIASHWKLAMNGDDPARRWALIVADMYKLRNENRLRPGWARLLPVAEERLAWFEEAAAAPR